MIQDKHQQFSDAQAFTGTGALCTNHIDLTEAKRLFAGEPMVVVFNVDVAAKTSDADETYEFAIETDDNTGFASATILMARSIARATLVAGYQFTVPVPMEAVMERYLGARVNMGGTLPTITITASLMPMSMVQANHIYPDNITIS